MHNLIGAGVFLGVLVLVFLLRRVLGMFWSASIFFFATTAYVKMGFEPAVPQSVVIMYISVTLIGVLLYVASSAAAREAFFGPIVGVIVEKRLWPVRWLLLLLVPGLIAWQSWEASLPSEVPPPKIRSVHPSPPSKISGQGHGDAEAYDLDIIAGHNPFRADEGNDGWGERLERGKAVYYQNCYYCHGDHMSADGHYADAVKPPPANFTDPGTIPMLTETFLFWRIAKGGPGLPDAGTPWDSSMPVWENILSVDDMWNVLLYMFEHTGFEPRKTDEGH